MTELTNAKAWADIDRPMRFRIIKETTKEPLSDWSTNLQEIMEHLEQRPDWAPREVCINERNEVIPSVVGVWDARGKIIQVPWSEVPLYEGNEPWIDPEEDAEDAEAKFEQAATAAETEEEIDDGSTTMSSAELLQLLIDRAEQKDNE